MGWGAAIGIALLTALSGAGAAGYLASLCVTWYRISAREGGSGYFIVSIGLIGLLVGFVAGLITARMVSGFLQAQGSALAVVLGLCLAIGFFARLNGEVPPKLNGEMVRLEVDLRCPPGWTPDNKARGDNVSWLRPLRSGQFKAAVAGSAILEHTAEADGSWIAHSSVWLFSSRPVRILQIALGDKVNLQIDVPLPASLSNRDEQWSKWTSGGVMHPVGKPPITDYQFRYRVRRDSVVLRENEAAAARSQQAREDAIAAVSPDAPLTDWLPFFEKGSSGLCSDSVDPRAIEAINSRAPELKPLLQSANRRVTMQAVFATGLLHNIPADFIPPLAAAGHLTIQLIQEARTGAQQSDPDLAVGPRASGYFFKWSLAMQLAGAPAAEPFRVALLEIEHEAGAEKTGDVETIGRYAREYLQTLARAQ